MEMQKRYFQKLKKNYQYIETERVKVKYKENAEYTEQFIKQLKEIIYVFLTIFLYLLKCPQSLIL